MKNTSDRSAFFIALISIALTIIGLLVFMDPPIFPPVSAQSRDSGRFRIEYNFTEGIGTIEVYCDQANGNLIYVQSNGGTHAGSIAVSENKCQMDPRFHKPDPIKIR